MRRVECLAAEYVSATCTLTSLASNASRSIRDASPEVEYYNPIGPKARTGGSEPVEALLDSLRIPVPDRARIMELFELMGIHTQDYLELFATMETRDGWLRELVAAGELTPIQMRLLREGLDMMRCDV